jgi:hypothetical protein
MLEACIGDLFDGLKALTDAINTSAKRVPEPQPDGLRCEDLPLAIALDDNEWQEVANAIQLKAERLRKEEQPDEDMTQEQLNEWAETLESAYKKITKVLDRNHITY